MQKDFGEHKDIMHIHFIIKSSLGFIWKLILSKTFVDNFAMLKIKN